MLPQCLLLHFNSHLAYTEKHWSIAFWVKYYYCNTSTREKKLSPLPGGTCYSTLLQASKQTSSFGKKQHSFCKDLCRGSRSHMKELCALQKFCQKPREGAEPGLEAGSCWNCHLQWARIPKGAGFFMLSHLLYSKTGIKIRQLLLLPTPTLWVPLNLVLGLPHLFAPGSGSVEAGLLSGDWDTTHFMPFISFTNSGQGSKLHMRKWSRTIISFIYQNSSALKTEIVSVYPVTTQE